MEEDKPIAHGQIRCPLGMGPDVLTAFLQGCNTRKASLQTPSMGHAAQSPGDYSEGSKTSTTCQLGPNPSRSHRADAPCPVHTEAGSLAPCNPPGLTSAPPPPSALIPATLAVYLPSFNIREVFAHGQSAW